MTSCRLLFQRVTTYQCTARARRLTSGTTTLDYGGLLIFAMTTVHTLKHSSFAPIIQSAWLQPQNSHYPYSNLTPCCLGQKSDVGGHKNVPVFCDVGVPEWSQCCKSESFKYAKSGSFYSAGSHSNLLVCPRLSLSPVRISPEPVIDCLRVARYVNQRKREYVILVIYGGIKPCRVVCPIPAGSRTNKPILTRYWRIRPICFNVIMLKNLTRLA